jgi:tetratricopeptide (TPR) repeat protein
MNYYVRLSIFNALESALQSPEQANRVHCKDVCAKNYSFQLAIAYSIGFCGLQDELKLKQYLQDSSFDHQSLDDVLENLRTDQLSLSYTGEFERLLLDGFVHLVDFTVQNPYSNTDEMIDEKCMREAYASEYRLGATSIVTIMLKQVLASVYKSKSQFHAAARLEKENLDAVLEDSSNNNPMIPKLLLRLGSTYCQLEKYKEALELQQMAVKLVNRIYEDGHPSVSNASATLASTLWRYGKWEKAERLFSELLERNESLLDSRHPETIALRANLAMAKKKIGKTKEAEKLEREAVTLSLETLGPDSTVTWNISANLSRTYMEQGQFETAGEFLESLRKRQKAHKSEDHPEKLRALNILADSYRCRRRFEDARQILDRTASIQKKLQGENHLDTIRTNLLLAKCHYDEGNSSGAVSLLRELLRRVSTMASSDDISWSVEAMTELATQLKQHGLLADSGELEEKIVTSRRETVGPAHLSTMVATASLCETLVKLDDFEKEDEYEASLSDELLEKLEGDAAVTVKILADLGSTYIDKNELDRAQRVLEKALKAASHVLGADHMVTWSLLCNLASAYALKGMAEEAFAAYLKATKAKLRTLGEANTSTQITMANFKYFCDCVGLDWDSVKEVIIPSS